MRVLLEHVGVERAVVGGLSLGGYASLAFYMAHPEMVRALVIISSGPGFRNAEARAQWNERAHRRAAELETQGLAALEGGSADMTASRGWHRSAQALAHAARGMLAQEDARVIDSLPAIKVPTLVVLGDRDDPFGAEPLHGRQDPGRAAGRDRGGGARRQPGPARGIQSGPAYLPGRARVNALRRRFPRIANRRVGSNT
jgi:pimeloyl-ACP methyl ester carboxylesterase